MASLIAPITFGSSLWHDFIFDSFNKSDALYQKQSNCRLSLFTGQTAVLDCLISQYINEWHVCINYK